MQKFPNKQAPLLSKYETVELFSGISLLAVLAWILWWKGFGPISEERISLVWAMEMISVILLFQLYGIVGILRSPQTPKSGKKLRWIQLGIIIVLSLSMLAQVLHIGGFDTLEAQNIRRFLYLVVGAAPLLQLIE